MERFCAICIDGTEGLLPGEDGRLECARCRREHPRSGRYGVDVGGDVGRSSEVPARERRKRGAE